MDAHGDAFILANVIGTIDRAIAQVDEQIHELADFLSLQGRNRLVNELASLDEQRERICELHAAAVAATLSPAATR